MNTIKVTALCATFALTLAALAGCAPTTSGNDSDGTLSIVASTNAWGDVAKQIGGNEVTVTSIITDASQDPHSYEANVRVQLALSKADIVIVNGGGYDSFVHSLLKGLGGTNAKVLNAVNISGLPHSNKFNEHVWYDLPTVKKMAVRITKALSTLDPSRAQTFVANEKTFTDALSALEAEQAAIKAGATPETGVAITEPVPLYLLTASGLVNKTPAAFSEAIDDATDVAPRVLHQTLALFTNHRVSLLVFNEQTSGPETAQVISAAKSAGIPVVAMTETLPRGKNYLQWMTGNLAAVKAALR